MGAYHRRIYHEVFHIGIMHEMLMHSFPDTLITPSGEPLVDAVPLAILAGQQSPLGAPASHPKDGFDEEATFGFLSSVNIWTLIEVLIYL
jgi:hypothetical protein